jgi:hypothetical protein
MIIYFGMIVIFGMMMKLILLVVDELSYELSYEMNYEKLDE